MSSAKERVYNRIRKKIKNNKRSAKRFAKKAGIQTLTANFVNKVEEIKETATDAVSFTQLLEAESLKYHRYMQCIDPEISLALNWYKEEELNESKWEDFRLEGVTITWSSFYLGKHPFVDATRYIDIGELWLQGYFSEEES